MCFSLNSLRLHTSDRFLLSLQLELKPLNFVLVIRALPVSFLDPVAQVVPLALQEFVGALKCLDFAREH